MDLDDFRSILETAGVDVWTFIDTAITVASLDFGNDLKYRRDGIVERLYAATPAPASCRNCEPNHLRSNARGIGAPIKEHSSPLPDKSRASPATPQSLGKDDNEDDEEIDPYGGLFDDEQKKILEIKELLEDPNQSEESLVDLLQSLADMDITFQALKDTDIGRHVNRLRKHSSNDVRRLVKLLVRKWKDIVDEWVRLNPPAEHASLMGNPDGDSPPPKTTAQNGYHQIPDFAYSPNPHNGSSGSDRNNSEAELKQKPIPRKEAPPKPAPSASMSTSAPPQNRQKEQRESNFDAERLASARRRLQENYKEAENAKKQRTIQVMDIHELPKPKAKNAFFAKNKGGGGGSQGRHW